MSEMKSAWERAMEKVEKLGKPTEDELKQLEYVPTGNRLAAEFIQNQDFNLDAELTKYKGTGSRKFVLQGAEETFLRNIMLPRNEAAKNAIRRAMAGLRAIKENKKQLESIFDRVNNLISYYEQALQQAYTQFRQDFETKMKSAAQNLQRQPQNMAAFEAQVQAQFQEEWRRVSGQLDAQYQKALEEHKQQIMKIA